MSSDLRQGKCQACEGGVEKLADDKVTGRIGSASGWRLEQGSLCRDFQFKNFYETMAFVNAVAWIADRENHHPDMEIGYGYCLLRYSTHSVKGITENDFICAAQVNQLLE